MSGASVRKCSAATGASPRRCSAAADELCALQIGILAGSGASAAYAGEIVSVQSLYYKQDLGTFGGLLLLLRCVCYTPMSMKRETDKVGTTLKHPAHRFRSERSHVRHPGSPNSHGLARPARDRRAVRDAPRRQQGPDPPSQGPTAVLPQVVRRYLYLAVLPDRDCSHSELDRAPVHHQ